MHYKSVLIIDDHENTREVIGEYLKAEGFLVTCCANGADGLDLVKERRYDAIVVDYNMPDMNGDDLVKRMRSRRPNALIIGFSAERREREFLKAGADAFMNKSDVTKDLIPLLKKARW